MDNVQTIFSRGRWKVTAVISTVMPILFVLPPPLRAQEHSSSEMHAGMSMDEAPDPIRQAKLLADKRESEFNHHVAGVFVVFAGLFLLAEGSIRNRWPFVRYGWPLCFLLGGLFVLIWSDTELWPFGPQSWYFGLTHQLEVLQHKLFALILLALGVIELQRARGALKAAWSGWVFPFLAVAGSAMLFFHDHHAGMHGPHHMELMQRIQGQHLGFSVAGFGIGLSKGLAERQFSWRPFFERLFPTLLVVLGALLMAYVE